MMSFFNRPGPAGTKIIRKFYKSNMGRKPRDADAAWAWWQL